MRQFPKRLLEETQFQKAIPARREGKCHIPQLETSRDIPIAVSVVGKVDSFDTIMMVERDNNARDNMLEQMQNYFNDLEAHGQNTDNLQNFRFDSGFIIFYHPWKNAWMRAGIALRPLHPEEPDSIRVFAIDYGRYCVIEKNQVRVMREQFAAVSSAFLRGKIEVKDSPHYNEQK